MSHKSQSPLNLSIKPLLLVLSGLSGAGKDAVLSRMKELDYRFERIITMTTRPRRPREKDGVDYHFVLREKFQEMVERNELLEWAKVYDNWYGVPKTPVRQALAKGQDVVIKVDVQGAATIKKILPQAVFIFLAPQSTEELISRLKQRNTESPAGLTLRVKTAEEELKYLSLFDYIVFNRQDKIDQAVSDIGAIITAEKCRVTPREISL